MPTIKSLLDLSQDKLRAVSGTPRLDAELLMCYLLKIDRAKLFSKLKEDIDCTIQLEFNKIIERRKSAEPLAYITGKKEFYGYEFEVSPSVLIPRPETELLVELSLQHLVELTGRLNILDLGTGSGCIAVVLALELQKLGRDFTIDAADQASAALDIAAKNAARHSVSKRINFVQSNWFSAFKSLNVSYDLIVSNPPYIAEGDRNISTETKYEPGQALFSGPEGLDSIRLLMLESKIFLNRQGLLVCEIGSSQFSLIQDYYRNFPYFNSSTLTFCKDLAGMYRAIKLKFEA
mgnify:CR=1 FL=1